MKGKIFLLSLWLLFTLILTFSVFGMLLFIRSDGNVKHWQGIEGRSSWMAFGHKLLDDIVKK